MKESRKEFIKKAHSAACSEWKTNIEKEFPKLFKKDALVVGKWYKSNEGHLICVKKLNGLNMECFGFGVWPREWSSVLKWADYTDGFTYTPAFEKEEEEALIKEAKKRGLKPLNHRCLEDNKIWANNIGGKYEYYPKENKLMIGASTAFLDGEWAEIIKETITKEQAEK